MSNYIKGLRSKLGHAKFICPSARIIVENENQEVLVIERADNGKTGIPAGSLEENETIEACIIREVREETGIKITALEVIGISSNPDAETVRYPNGDEIQYFTVEFYTNRWEGTLKPEDGGEVKSARFASPEIVEQLPDNERSAFESLAYYRKEKKIMLK